MFFFRLLCKWKNILFIYENHLCSPVWFLFIQMISVRFFSLIHCLYIIFMYRCVSMGLFVQLKKKYWIHAYCTLAGWIALVHTKSDHQMYQFPRTISDKFRFYRSFVACAKDINKAMWCDCDQRAYKKFDWLFCVFVDSSGGMFLTFNG